MIGQSYMENQKNGEYEFVLSASEFAIRIKFNIKANGEISYNKPELA